VDQNKFVAGKVEGPGSPHSNRFGKLAPAYLFSIVTKELL